LLCLSVGGDPLDSVLELRALRPLPFSLSSSRGKLCLELGDSALCLGVFFRANQLLLERL
jgi:hypothetical protein